MKIESEGALIVNTRFEIKNIHFVCFLCGRLSIFTNEFVNFNNYSEMICADGCQSKVFLVRTLDK